MHECNFVVKDYRDLHLRLLLGQTRAKVNQVLSYFGARESDQLLTIRSHLGSYKLLMDNILIVFSHIHFSCLLVTHGLVLIIVIRHLA